MGRRVFANLPNGKSIRHFYDGSVLEEIRIGPPYPGTSIARNVLLHPSGALAQIDYLTISGGSSYTYEPDTHRLAAATSWRASGALQDLAFDYDLAGNLTGVNDVSNELDQVFTYDGLHRLATATGSGSSGYGSLGFGYDDAGNLTSKGALGNQLMLTYAGGNAGPHGVTGVSGAETGSFGYDDDGQVTAKTRSGVSQSLIRDDDGRIREVPYSGDYVYDETGERARKQAQTGAGDTLYVDPEYEVDLVNTKHKIHYFHFSRRVATETRQGFGLPGSSGGMLSRQFYFPDFVGSNSVVARNDGTLQKSFFRPFGEFAQQGGGMTPYLFTDQEHDPESGLQYFGARHYDPWVGRFMSPDPDLIGNYTGITFSAIAVNPQQFNAYSYALNAPTIYTDPTGRCVRLGVSCGVTERYGWSRSTTITTTPTITTASERDEVGPREDTSAKVTAAVTGAGSSRGVQVAGGNELTDEQALREARQLEHGLIIDPGHPLARSGFGEGTVSSPETEILIQATVDAYADLILGIATGEAGGIAARWFGVGREFLWFKMPGWIERIAPFGNRTGDPLGRFPHYHRRVPDPTKPGESLPGQGIGRHRPWETRPSDSSWWDRW